jgi:hypothetical protein
VVLQAVVDLASEIVPHEEVDGHRCRSENDRHDGRGDER